MDEETEGRKYIIYCRPLRWEVEVGLIPKPFFEPLTLGRYED